MLLVLLPSLWVADRFTRGTRLIHVDLTTNSAADANTVLSGDKVFSANRCYTAIHRRTNSLVQVGTPLFFDFPLRFSQAQASPPPGFTPFPSLPF